MAAHLGYACLHTRLPSPARTTRLANATPARLLELAAANLEALERILRWNADNGIQVFRLSSGTIPLGGHPVNEVPWWKELREPLARIGALAREEAMRLSMHPGQYTVLGSPDERLVAASLADLEYHARLLRALELDTTHGVVLHPGGVYGDRRAAADRFVRAVEGLSDDARARLRLEHDERWSFAETLPLAARLGIPVVFDVFHHGLRPSFEDMSVRDLVERVGAAWPARQELHFSTQDPRRRPGAHAETLDADALERFLAEVGDLDVDVVLEVKDKERSVLAARERLYTGAP